MKKHKVNIITLGCSKNLVDSEFLMGQLFAKGFRVTHQHQGKFDAVIINTCGFINDAKQESINTILEQIEAKKYGLTKKVIVMGCLSQRYKAELMKELPEVDSFFGVAEMPDVIKELGDEFAEDSLSRILTTPPHYAYLKISEGCDRKCSFCAIPSIRGRHVSKSINELFKEAEMLAGMGVKELILISQDLSYYGIDISKEKKLSGLVKTLAEMNSFDWIRLHYAYPDGFPLDLLDVMANYPAICKYLDIPLQHINNRILKSMRRGHNRQDTIKLLKLLHDRVPGIAIRTSLIVGYPGETLDEFNELKEWVAESKFERLGVFTYSEEEGTVAAKLADSVPEKEKYRRMEEIMQIQQEISLNINKDRIGKTLKVLVDREEGEYYIGRTEYDSPEVDNEVLISREGAGLVPGNFYNVIITNADFYDLYAKVLTI